MLKKIFPAVLIMVFLSALLAGCAGPLVGQTDVIIQKPTAQAPEPAPQAARAQEAARPAPTPSPAARELLQRATVFMLEGQRAEALDAFERFAATYPNSSNLDEALFALARIHEDLDQPDQATAAYTRLLEERPGSAFAGEVRLRLARLLLSAGRFEPAAQLLEGLVGQAQAQGARAELKVWLSQALAGLDRFEPALTAAVDAYYEAGSVAVKYQAKRQALATLLAMPPEALERAAGSLAEGFPAGYTNYILAYRLFQARDFLAARRVVRGFMDAYYGHEAYMQARALAAAIDGYGQPPELDIMGLAPALLSPSVSPGVPGPQEGPQEGPAASDIAVILPLTGPAAVYGQEVLGGVRLALELYEPQSPDFRPNLVVKDSAGVEETAVLAIDEAAADEKVIGVIGPLSSRTAALAAQRAQGQGLPMLCLSQREGVPQLGSFIFRLFLSPEAQAQAVAGYVIQILGLTKLAIVYPEDVYGNKMRDAFWDEVNRLGAEIVGVESYDPRTTDFSKQIQTLAGLDRADRSVEAGHVTEVNFQAVFMPDGYKAVAMITPQFAYHDIVTIRMLGTTLWHNPLLIESAARYIQGAVFPASFYADMEQEHVARFVKAFQERHEGREPGKFEAYGYDAAMLLLSLMDQEKVTTRLGLVRALNRLSGFPGVTGAISFSPEGELITDPPLLTVKGSRFVLLGR